MALKYEMGSWVVINFNGIVLASEYCLLDSGLGPTTERTCGYIEDGSKYLLKTKNGLADIAEYCSICSAFKIKSTNKRCRTLMRLWVLMNFVHIFIKKKFRKNNKSHEILQLKSRSFERERERGVRSKHNDYVVFGNQKGWRGNSECGRTWGDLPDRGKERSFLSLSGLVFGR